MRITPDRITVLINYGFSEYQARVYLALLEFPSLNAGTLAKVAQIPRNRLYEVLEELQTLGLVEIILDETRKYRAKPLSVYLDSRVSDLNERIKEIESRREYLSVAFQPTAQALSPELEAGATRVVMGRRAVAREIDRLLEEAPGAVACVASAGGFERVVRHVRKWSEALAEQPAMGAAKLEIYLPRAVANHGGFERLGEPWIHSIHWIEPTLSTLAFIAEGSEALWIHAIPDDDRLFTGRDFAILTTSSAFVKDQLAFARAAAKGDGHSPPPLPPLAAPQVAAPPMEMSSAAPKTGGIRFS
ncbi:MAG: TrmB family transcriptional regulator [Thermoplasmatota archaeon]